eukprot:6181967-Pleurochrysis_carterae.AAC.3
MRKWDRSVATAPATNGTRRRSRTMTYIMRITSYSIAPCYIATDLRLTPLPSPLASLFRLVGLGY